MALPDPFGTNSATAAQVTQSALSSLSSSIEPLGQTAIASRTAVSSSATGASGTTSATLPAERNTAGQTAEQSPQPLQVVLFTLTFMAVSKFPEPYHLANESGRSEVSFNHVPGCPTSQRGGAFLILR